MATAFRPVLPGMLAATYARGGQTEEVRFHLRCLCRVRQGCCCSLNTDVRVSAPWRMSYCHGHYASAVVSSHEPLLG